MDRGLQLADVVNGVLAGQETEVVVALNAEILEYDQILIVPANDVDFVVIIFGCRVLLFGLGAVAIVRVLLTRRKREARIALIKIPLRLELLLEVCLRSVPCKVFEQFVDDAAE